MSAPTADQDLLNRKGYPPQVAPDPPYRKPAYGEPCNNCGECCLAEPCQLSQAYFRIEKTEPCPALLWTYGGSRCGLMQEPAMFAPVRARIYGETRMKQAAKRLLGSGRGCDCRYVNEIANEAFYTKVEAQKKSMEKLLQCDQKVWGVKFR